MSPHWKRKRRAWEEAASNYVRKEDAQRKACEAVGERERKKKLQGPVDEDKGVEDWDGNEADDTNSVPLELGIACAVHCLLLRKLLLKNESPPLCPRQSHHASVPMPSSSDEQSVATDRGADVSTARFWRRGCRDGNCDA